MELLSIFFPLFLAYSVMLLQRSLGMMGEPVRLLIFVNFLYRLTSLDSEHPLVDREGTQPCIAVLQHLLKKDLCTTTTIPVSPRPPATERRHTGHPTVFHAVS